jgi:predicted HAD superfamily Cof-like phosphohydrolase
VTAEQKKVEEFHRKFGVPVSDRPTKIGPSEMRLRLRLIQEELDELWEAYYLKEDLAAVADALGDLLYVVYGAAVCHGLDMELIFNEIHRSNMTKVGGRTREDGKILKPDSYEPPQLAAFCEEKS